MGGGALALGVSRGLLGAAQPHHQAPLCVVVAVALELRRARLELRGARRLALTQRPARGRGE